MGNRGKVRITYIKGHEGDLLYLNAHRIAGPKVFGVKESIKEWHVDVVDVLEALEEEQERRRARESEPIERDERCEHFFKEF